MSGFDEADTLVDFQLRLYVAGTSPRSTRAYMTLTTVCEARLPGRYSLEVVDLFKEPKRAALDQIAVLPCLVRLAPGPHKRMVGGLCDSARVSAIFKV